MSRLLNNSVIKPVLTLLLLLPMLAGVALAFYDVKEKGELRLMFAADAIRISDLIEPVAFFLIPITIAVVLLSRRRAVSPYLAALAFLPCALGWLRFTGNPEVWPNEDEILRSWWMHWLVLQLAVSFGALGGLLTCLGKPSGPDSESESDSPATEPTDPSPYSWRRDRAFLTLAVLALAYAGTMFTLSLLRFQAYKPGMLDLGMYDQLHWATFNHVPFYTTTFELPWGISLRQSGYNYNAEHFMPIILLTSLPYALWPGPPMLFAIQSLLMGLAALPLYFLALRLTGRRYIAFMLGLGWLLHPLVQQANLKDFHPDALEGVFILAAFWFFELRRPLLYAAALGLAMMCKEDVALLVVAMGAFLIVARRDVKWGAATILAGAIYFFGVAQPIMAAALGDTAAEPVIRHLERFSPLVPEGATQPESLGDLVLIVLQNPGNMLNLLGEVPRQWGLQKLLIPIAALCLLYPPAWLLILPVIGLHIFSRWTMQARFELYHAATVLPWLFALTAYTLGWLYGNRGLALIPGNRAPLDTDTTFGESTIPSTTDAVETDDASTDSVKTASVASTTVCLAARSRGQLALANGSVWALTTAIALGFYLFGHLPPGDNYTGRDYLRLDRHATSDLLLEQVPSEAAVAAVSELGPHLTRRTDIFLLPDLPDRTKYVAHDIFAGTYPLSKGAYHALIREQLESGEWGVVWHHADGQFLLQRGAPTDDNGTVLERLN